MDQDGTWHGGGPQSTRRYVRWGTSSPHERGTAAPPLFGPCLLWPRLPISATSELLFKGILCKLVWKASHLFLRHTAAGGMVQQLQYKILFNVYK